MADHLARSVHPDSTIGATQEFHDCVKTILMLAHLQGCIFVTAMSATSSGSINDGRSSFLPTRLTDFGPSLDPSRDSAISQMERGILTYVAQLSQVWHMARGYAACRVSSDALPPWSSQSDYSSVMSRHLEIDCSVPRRYRFSSNDFEGQDADALERNRDYWGPWLFVQFTYAAIPCLLNHPFLLSMRLRNFRDTIPHSFIHQSFEQTTRHAGWIVYFIDLLEKKSFVVSDPTLAHCVAIVATIHLQHSFVKDQSLRDKAQEGYDKCIRFLRRMGNIWPSISVMVRCQATTRNSSRC